MNVAELLETEDIQTIALWVRNERNRLLAASDWTQVADAPVDREAWATYRQQLRDFPATWTPGPTADFPEPPA
jgi:hypothetical protein